MNNSIFIYINIMMHNDSSYYITNYHCMWTERWLFYLYNIGLQRLYNCVTGKG